MLLIEPPVPKMRLEILDLVDKIDFGRVVHLVFNLLGRPSASGVSEGTC